MSIKRNIQRAYDPIHAPEDVIERMKQELYQKDLNQDEEHEIFRVETSPRLGIGKYLLYTAAMIGLCCGLGYAFQMAQEYRTDFHPGQAVYTESAEPLKVPKLVGISMSEASALLDRAKITYEIHRVASDQPAGTVISQSVSPGTYMEQGEVLVLEIAE